MERVDSHTKKRGIEVDKIRRACVVCRDLIRDKLHYHGVVSDMYTGYYTPGSVLGIGHMMTVRPGILDVWKTYREWDHNSDVNIDDVFPIEFATNMKKNADGSISLLSNKRMCLDVHEYIEIRMDWTQNGMPDDMLLDFLWNVMHLKLRSSRQIIAFVSDTTDDRDEYLLSEDNVTDLIQNGKHVKVPLQQPLIDALHDINSIMKSISPQKSCRKFIADTSESQKNLSLSGLDVLDDLVVQLDETSGVSWIPDTLSPPSDFLWK
jgi:hypothetical protein